MVDVARVAGVSTATVSRALRDLPGVSAPTRSRIKLLAESLSYVVSPEASGLSRRSTGRVAIVVRSLNLWFFSSMLAGIEGVLRGADLDVLVYQVEGAANRREFFQRLPVRRKVDALVVIALPVPEHEARRLDLMGVHVVVAGGSLHDYPHVGIDDVEAARQATRHLVELGHRRVAMIRTSDPEGYIWPADVLRSDGYRETLLAADLDFDEQLLVTVPRSIDAGARAMDRLLSLRVAPTAVFACSDELAIGALRSLRRAHVAVPERMSIVGIDDHPMAELNDLTTVHQSVGAQGSIAAEMVLDMLNGGAPHTHRTVPTFLVVRNSTAPPPRREPRTS